MKMLVTGGSGLVGWDLTNRALSRGHDTTYTYLTNDPASVHNRPIPSHRVNIRDAERIYSVIAREDPDMVVHAAAMTDVDECERSPDLADAVNVHGTRNVADACEQVDADVLFFSTSFVFAGEDEAFDEDDERSATNHYGRTKIEAEDVVSASSVDTTICRIDQPYCWPEPWQADPFVSWILNRLRDGRSFPVFDDWYNTPVYVPDCNEVVLDLVEEGTTGTYHVCGPDYVSRYEWARAIAEEFGYDPDLVERGHSADTDLPAERPNNRLRTDAVRRVTDQKFHTIREALSEMAAKRPDAID